MNVKFLHKYEQMLLLTVLSVFACSGVIGHFFNVLISLYQFFVIICSLSVLLRLPFPVFSINSVTNQFREKQGRICETFEKQSN